MIRNVVRAVLGDEDFYARVASDSSLMFQAFVVVVVANALDGLGASLATDASLILGAVVGMLTGVVGWLIWTGIAYLVGVRMFGGHADYREMLRVIGFSYAPLAIGVIPWLGFVGAAWALFAAVVAIRVSMEFSTRRAILTTGFGWAAWLGLAVLVNTFLDFDFAIRWANPFG